MKFVRRKKRFEDNKSEELFPQKKKRVVKEDKQWDKEKKKERATEEPIQAVRLQTVMPEEYEQNANM